MFFCRKKSKSGQVLQLLESYRNRQGRPTHRVVVSLGDASLPETSWKAVAKFVESKLYGYRELFPPDPDDQIWIDSIVKRIEREGKWQPGSHEKLVLGSREPKEENKLEGEVLDGVLIDEVDHTHETTLGPELVGLKAWDDLNMDDFLKELGFSGAQRRASACSVINRLVDPVSEHCLPLWLQSSSLPDILGEDTLYSSHDKYYKISDLLYERREELEEHLSKTIASHFGFQRTYILYDLTNTHFEGECCENDKAKRGRNKQKRHDCVQVVVGVCFDEHGFVLFHKTFSGNMSDSKSLLEMVSAMLSCSEESNFFSSQTEPMVIIDAGIATQDNVKLLRKEGFSYLVNETRQSRSKYKKYFNEKEFFTPVMKGDKELTVKIRHLDLCDVEAEAEEIQVQPTSGSNKASQDNALGFSGASQENNHADAISQPDNKTQPLKERLVLCRSTPRKSKEEAIYSGAEKKFLERLEKLSSRIKKGQLKDPEKIQRSIGGIQACHSRASKYYKVTYTPPEKEENKSRQKEQKPRSKNTGNISMGTLSFHRKDKKLQADAPGDPLLGCYVLRSDKCDIPADQLWHLYMTLSKAEDGFRALKSDCGLRPNHHQLERRVDAHIFISILAYQLQRFILYQLEQRGDHRSWSTVRRVLQTHTYSTIIVPTSKGTIYRLRKPGIPEECQRHIYNQLDVSLNRLPKAKICINRKSTTL